MRWTRASTSQGSFASAHPYGTKASAYLRRSASVVRLGRYPSKSPVNSRRSSSTTPTRSLDGWVRAHEASRAQGRAQGPWSARRHSADIAGHEARRVARAASCEGGRHASTRRTSSAREACFGAGVLRRRYWVGSSFRTTISHSGMMVRDPMRFPNKWQIDLGRDDP